MTYYTSPHDETVPMLLELLAAEADASPAWTLQGLLALCRETSFLDEQPQCADHFDSVYLVLAELFVQFQQTGRLSGPPEALTKVGSFTLDAAAQQEVTAALAALQSGQIRGTAPEADPAMAAGGQLAGMAAADCRAGRCDPSGTAHRRQHLPCR